MGKCIFCGRHFDDENHLFGDFCSVACIDRYFDTNPMMRQVRCDIMSQTFAALNIKNFEAAPDNKQPRHATNFKTELIAKCFGWTCECCGSDKDLDAYALNSNWEKDENGMMIHDHRNENLICLCPKCYKKYHENPIEALHHMTNPQIFKFPAKDPRLEKYCK